MEGGIELITVTILFSPLAIRMMYLARKEKKHWLQIAEDLQLTYQKPGSLVGKYKGYEVYTALRKGGRSVTNTKIALYSFSLLFRRVDCLPIQRVH